MVTDWSSKAISWDEKESLMRGRKLIFCGVYAADLETGILNNFLYRCQAKNAKIKETVVQWTIKVDLESHVKRLQIPVIIIKIA